MKTTLDLPENLVREIKIRAVNRRQKLKDAVEELLRRGLAAPETDSTSAEPVVRRDKKTGLPVIECRHAATPATEMTPDRVANILLNQEAEWHLGARR
ncbi:MAG TPA: hypothetical protein VHR66_24500 [Gemmataceae bacterium]|jgi:hypothetical protein|nr:hypothetical protein [Gemmataceae bacterium]